MTDGKSMFRNGLSDDACADKADLHDALSWVLAASATERKYSAGVVGLWPMSVSRLSFTSSHSLWFMPCTHFKMNGPTKSGKPNAAIDLMYSSSEIVM